MKVPDALMRHSPTKVKREARGLTRAQWAAECGSTGSFIFLKEKLEANLVFRLCILELIHQMNEAEPNMMEVCRQVASFCHRTTRKER